MVREDKVEKIVDAKLEGAYPLKAVEKVIRTELLVFCFFYIQTNSFDSR